MAFGVPAGHERLSDEVFNRFRSLALKKVIDIVSATTFDAWWRNFPSPEEQYLAAQLLSAAVIRTEQMKRSSCRQVVEMILPSLLRSAGGWNYGCIGEMEQALERHRGTPVPVKFMPVDGSRLDARPGNSGDATVRQFGISARVADRYFVRADDDSIWADPPPLLVLLDDLLGTGSQFDKFAREYRLGELPAETMCVYIPWLATTRGIARAAERHPRVKVWPVEVLDEAAGFFSGALDEPRLWGRDRYNTCTDARDFYEDLMRRRGVRPEGPYGMELTVLLPGRAPNNTLRAFWHENDQWKALLRR